MPLACNNPLTNLGFEDGSTDPWAASGAQVTLTNDTTTPHSGTRALKVLTNADNSQSAIVDIANPGSYGGRTVTFKAWARKVIAQNQCRLQLTASPDAAVNSDIVTGTDYTYIQVSKAVPVGCTLLRLFLVDTGGPSNNQGAWFDDLEFQVSPPLTSGRTKRTPSVSARNGLSPRATVAVPRSPSLPSCR